MRQERAKIVSWHQSDGFGFARLVESDEKVLVNRTVLPDPTNPPPVGEIIRLNLIDGPDGKPVATGAHWKLPKEKQTLASLLGVTFVSGMFLVASLGYVHIAIPVAYVLVSFVTYWLYAGAKVAYIQGRQGTAESRLHMLESLGGWPGAAMSMQKFRYRLHEDDHQASLASCILVNFLLLAVVIWAMTPEGAEIVRTAFYMAREQAIALWPW